MYWITHSLALLGSPVGEATADDVAAFLRRCQAPSGGFGGGPEQQPHLATTYAAVCSLVTVGGAAAAAAVDRPAMAAFLARCKVPPSEGGGFRLSDGGEADTRGCYTALAVASLLGLSMPALSAGVGAYLARCQTFEGGLGGEPGAEAHGGYSFCGLAAAVLAGQAAELHLPRLLHWAVGRQGTLEGGFNGRTNKLVDGCYSFWQGGLLALLQRQMPLLLAQLSPQPPPPQPQPQKWLAWIARRTAKTTATNSARAAAGFRCFFGVGQTGRPRPARRRWASTSGAKAALRSCRRPCMSQARPTSGCPTLHRGR